MSSALTERTLGTCRLGPAASGDGEDEFDAAPVDLLMTGNADRPGQPACAQGPTELGAHAVPGVDPS
jgi:hypothetical protein